MTSTVWDFSLKSNWIHVRGGNSVHCLLSLTCVQAFVCLCVPSTGKARAVH